MLVRLLFGFKWSYEFSVDGGLVGSRRKCVTTFTADEYLRVGGISETSLCENVSFFKSSRSAFDTCKYFCDPVDA